MAIVKVVVVMMLVDMSAPINFRGPGGVTKTIQSRPHAKVDGFRDQQLKCAENAGKYGQISQFRPHRQSAVASRIDTAS